MADLLRLKRNNNVVYDNSDERVRAWLLYFVRGIGFESRENNLIGCKKVCLSIIERTAAIKV